MSTVAPGVVFTDYHDLGFLAESVSQLRLNLGRPLTGSLAVELRTEIQNGLHNEWTVEMRYRRSGLGAAQAWDALLQAWWLKTNWTKLL